MKYLFLILLTSYFNTGYSQKEPRPWRKIPKRYLKKKNTVKATPQNIKQGEKLYLKHCVECHGLKGRGDGEKKVSVRTPDFLKDNPIKDQLDTHLFFKISIGRKPMPGYKKIIKDEKDIWKIIEYMKTLIP